MPNYSAIRYVLASRKRRPFGLRKRRRVPYRPRGAKRAKTGTAALVTNSSVGNVAIPTLGGLPSMWRHFRYADKHYNINPGAGGTLACQVFSANSLFDPDRTGVGHQPMGYDQLMVLYKHYCVHSAKINISIYNSDDTQHQYCGIALMPTATPLTSMSEYVEQGDGCYTLCHPLSDGPAQSLSWYFNARRFFGVKDPDDVEDLKGLVSSSPADEAFFHIWAQPSASSDTNSIIIGVCIDYWARLTEVSNMPQS